MNIETNSIRYSIVKSASNLFYKNGYHNTHIDEILKEANISQTTLNSYFNSKEDICIAHLKYKNEKFSKQVMAYVSQVPKGKERIMAVFNYLELFYKMDGFQGCWAIKILSEIPISNKLIRAEVMSQKNDFINFIETLINENSTPDSEKDFKELAQKVYLLLEGAVTQSNIHRKEWPIIQAKKMCLEILD